jgi:hypothetical protein
MEDVVLLFWRQPKRRGRSVERASRWEVTGLASRGASCFEYLWDSELRSQRKLKIGEGTEFRWSPQGRLRSLLIGSLGI